MKTEKRCLYCRHHLPVASFLPWVHRVPSIGISKGTANWSRAEKLIAKNNKKYQLYEDSFGPAIWWVFCFDVSHESEEEKQIIHWITTGEGSEPN